ncbi:MAG: FAD:protein FMN transferase [Capsulimonadales bacterium]|nr:FAD:protein FMN transferase [Capsulimonadales bacterium]
MTGQSPFVRVAVFAMRTRFEILLCGEDRESDLRAAGEEALEEIVRIESMLTVHRPDGMLHRLNAAAGQGPVRIDFPLQTFLRRALDLSLATDGAFDPTVGPLIDLWRGAGETGAFPSPEEIADCRATVGSDKVRLNDTEGTLALPVQGARFDPGAIGKGYALDRAASLLRETGVRCALLHGGTSSVVAIGAPPGSPDGWPIAVGNPPSDSDAVYLTDRALGVSGVHGRTFQAGRRSFGHVIDPRSGYPVDRSGLAACLHPSATVADALSTALLVVGEEGLPALSARFPEARWILKASKATPGSD